jgi:5-methylcytosine-specific restriction endonuclease McrA
MPAFLLTVSNTWLRLASLRRDLLVRNAANYERGMMLESFSWTVRNGEALSPGDVVYLLLQGTGSRGIIASGSVATGELKSEYHWHQPGDAVTAVDVHWNATVLPDEAMDTEYLRDTYRWTNWVPRAKSTEIAIQDEEDLADEWSRHLRRLGHLSSLAAQGRRRRKRSMDFARKAPRDYGSSAVTARSHLRAYRWDLLNIYPQHCSYCGLEDINVLEAVHLVPLALGGESTPANGRLLCANHHRSFTQGILTWDGDCFIESAPWIRVPPPEADTYLAGQVSVALGSMMQERGNDPLSWSDITVPLTLSKFVEFCAHVGLNPPDVLDRALGVIID